MFCQQCGKEVVEGHKFCGSCGEAVLMTEEVEQAVPEVGQSDVVQSVQDVSEEVQPIEENQQVYIEPGFSKLGNDPALDSHRKGNAKRRLIAGGIIGLIILIAIVGMWYSEEGRVTFEAIKIGSMFGIIPVIIALLASLKALTDKTYTGTVKKVKSKKNKESRPDMEDDRHARTFYTYKVIVNKDGFGKKKVDFGSMSPGGYYQIGDKVKHHKNFNYLEKFDKSNDQHIACIDCFTMNDKKETHCERCGLLLMK